MRSLTYQNLESKPIVTHVYRDCCVGTISLLRCPDPNSLSSCKVLFGGGLSTGSGSACALAESARVSFTRPLQESRFLNKTLANQI